VVSLVLAITLLALTAIPALAWNDQSSLNDQPIRCWRVLAADQIIESDGCFGPGDLPSLPVIMMRHSVQSQVTGITMREDLDHQPGKVQVESLWDQ
jgi:hypothetical protein